MTLKIPVQLSFVNSILVFFKTFTETPECFQGCQATSPPIPDGKIEPSPTVVPTESGTDDENRDKRIEGDDEENVLEADRQFWLVTVLRSDGKDPIITDLKNSLAKLYKTAFER